MKKLVCVVLIITLISSNFAVAAEPDPDLAKEREIGRKIVKQIEEEWPLTSKPAITSKLEIILRKLEPFMERRIDWEVRIVDSEAVNAFCLPGGYIFFTTGILDLLNTDSELAAVMAHEMIHADRKHGLRIAAESQKVSLGSLLVMILGAATGTAAPIVLAQVAQIAITSGYTMELESEADRLGMQALLKSGYSPTGMITVFERFMAEDYKQPIRDYGIYMDHPDTPKRLERAVQILHDKHIPIERKYIQLWIQKHYLMSGKRYSHLVQKTKNDWTPSLCWNSTIIPIILKAIHLHMVRQFLCCYTEPLMALLRCAIMRR